MLVLDHDRHNREDHDKCDTKPKNSQYRRKSRRSRGLRDRTLHLIGKILIDEAIEVFRAVRGEDLRNGIGLSPRIDPQVLT